MRDEYETSLLAALPPGLGRVALLRELALGRDPLSRADMTTLARQAIALLEGFYVHLALKRALHATDPVLRLRLLVRRLAETGEPVSEAEFHDELTAVFTSLRDCHTLYLRPEPYRSRIAFLPFLIEECADGFLVTKVAGAGAPGLVPGARVTHWNGTPIARAVERLAAATPGANPAARRARALDLLTFRWMGTGVQPDEDWVVLTFEDGGEARVEWLVVERPSPLVGTPAAAGLDPEGEWIRRVRAELFGARPGLVSFETFEEGGTAYGHLRIWSFNVGDDGLDAFLAEVRALVEEAPPDGLIVDIRGNPGGDVRAGERLLQLLTPARIESAGSQFANTEPAVRLAVGHHDRQWGAGRLFRARLAEALATAAPAIPSFPLTRPEELGDVGQRFQGPVVLVVDALSYSTSDVFAAGFEDHDVGPVIGTSRQTGAGGGNVWTYEQLRAELPAGELPDALPLGASFTLAVRALTRVGLRRGLLLEELGVVVEDDAVHALTRDDVLGGNADLRRSAVRALAGSGRGRHRLRARIEGDELVLAASDGLARVDVLLDGRPLTSVSGPRLDGRRVALGGAAPRVARVEGYARAGDRAPAVAWQWRADEEPGGAA